jgi:Omp85 superfamily domain
MIRFLATLLCCSLLGSSLGFSQGLLSDKPSTKGGKTKHLIAFPVILHSPELTWAAGGAGTYYFKFSRKDSLIRTSYIQSVGLVTLRKQLVLGFDGTIFFPNESYILRLNGSVSRFPDRFWGLGNDSKSENKEMYAISQYYFFPQLLKNIYKKFYVGVAYESQNVFSFEYYAKPDGSPSIFDTENVPGRTGSFTSGIGYMVLWDNRDNTFSSSKGLYFQYYTNQFATWLGSQFTYKSHILDIRKYLTLGHTSVMAFQYVGNFNVGDVPIRSMANIGSGSIMRGYYEGRFTDKNLMAAQAELRQHVYERLGFVAFAGVGRVAQTFSEFAFSGLKPSLGAGLRVAIDKSERLNVRLDYGKGQHAHGFYLNISEAF